VDWITIILKSNKIYTPSDTAFYISGYVREEVSFEHSSENSYFVTVKTIHD